MGDDQPEEQLRAALDGERANAGHWRRIARQRAEALDAIKRRPSVRIALALERRSQPLRSALGEYRDGLRRRIGRARLLAGAFVARRRVRRSRAALARALDRLPAHQGQPRSVSMVAVGGESSIGNACREAAAAPGELLCFLAPSSEPLREDWLDRLASEIGSDAVAATPLLLHPERPWRQATPHDLRVRELGLDVVPGHDGAPVARARAAGSAPDLAGAASEVAAASGACLLVDRKAYEAAGGLAPLDDADAAIVDLCVRLRDRGGRVVAVPGSVVVDHRPVHSPAELTRPIDTRGRAWRAVVDRHGPTLLRARGVRPAAQRTVAVTVAAPSAKMAHRWGDWHLAEALARSLRRHGAAVRVQTADRADDPAGRSCDVHLVLRGVHPVRRTPGQHHVLWVISHPESVEPAECDDADLVLVASSRAAADLRDRTHTPVEVLLQATDHHRFRPVPRDPRHAHPVAVVAKTRDVLRPIVADALAVGLRPAIYGTGWEQFVDRDLIVADYVANEALAAVYSSVGVLLNDHWDTMRAWGFVSNRLFDALACGAPVVSDHLPEIPELFGDAVPTYRDPVELRAVVDAVLEDPATARARAARGRQRVLDAHTFDHRAAALLDALARHGLDAR